MEIIFTAKTLGNQILEENQIDAYTQAIFSIYNTIKEVLDLSLLNSIIITEEYKEGLFDFQKKNGHDEFITDNEYGRGIAQVVSSEAECGETVYNIIIDKNLISMLVGDEQLEAVKSNLKSQEEYNVFLKSRQLAINTLYHEFGHVYEYSLNRTIEWIQNKEIKTDLFSQLTVIAQQCWSEYFACRIASKSFPFDETTAIEIIETCNTAEKELQKERSKYNRRLVGLDEFVIGFHEYTNFILKKIASSHGNLYCLNDSREKVFYGRSFN